MNCPPHVQTYGSALFRKAGNFISTSLNQCHVPLWKRNFEHASVKIVDLEFLLTRFRTQCYSSRKSSSSTKKTSRTKKVDPEQPKVMENEKDAFFVVRKGDVVGVFKSFADCQTQVGSSICDPPVSVYKGYSLTKETEIYLSSYGLKNARYTIRAADVKEDIFGALMPCPFQEPASSKGETSHNDATKKRPQDMLQLEYGVGLGSLGSIAVADLARKHVKLDPHAGAQITSSGHVSRFGSDMPKSRSCVVYFHFIEVLSFQVKELSFCFVVEQLQGLWKVKHEHMSELCEQAMKLKDKFLSFQINHVLRELNGEADAEANLAVKLAEQILAGIATDVVDISRESDLVYSGPPVSTIVKPLLPDLL
ncbi:hypothetical protein PVK06_017651 [Gossypium arboreum]|uniref:RNase H type-1 domain-containing protein n=1 Tax=Gossypium arboreum TaxID=29729 RepID=A0ABR0Q410_GOSAR|nr:hypothetical protein PVK06_017651 [Gossypium arboreum]